MRNFIKHWVAVIFALTAALAFGQTSTTNEDPTDSKQQYAFLGDLSLESGQKIQDCKIGYRTYGKLNSERSNTIIFPTWFGGTTKDLEDFIPGKMIDTMRYYVITLDALGNGHSSSPSNSIKQPRLQFPVFTIRDMVESQYKVLAEKMNIHHVSCVAGISMGGLQSFQWAVSRPSFMDKVISIVGTPQLSSSDLLWMNIYMEALVTDTAYHNGDYKGKPVLSTLSLIKQLILTTPEHVNKNISVKNFYAWFDTAKKDTVMDWNDFRRQLEACKVHDISKTTNSSLEDAAKLIKAKTLIITSSQDLVVNPIAVTKFAALVNAQLVTLTSDCGHLAVFCESDKINSAVHAFLLQ